MRLLTLRTILATSDLEDGAAAALRTASLLADLAEARLHVLHVQVGDEERCRERLAEQYALVAPESSRPERVCVRPGSPAEAIVQEALELSADAVVLGPHRKAGTEIGDMGSTAEAVVRTSPCPCLVAATELRLPLRSVLVPIEASDFSRATLAVALAWASALRPRGARAKLVALHITGGRPRDLAAEEVRRAVDRARALAGGAAFVDIVEEIDEATDVAGKILRRARSEPVDLLVMGTRADDISPSAIGSVSAAVARETPVPLLLVPPRYPAGG